MIGEEQAEQFELALAGAVDLHEGRMWRLPDHEVWDAMCRLGMIAPRRPSDIPEVSESGRQWLRERRESKESNA